MDTEDRSRRVLDPIVGDLFPSLSLWGRTSKGIQRQVRETLT